MKKARLILSASMIALMGLSAVTFSSCSKDDDCAVGYTGKNCDEEIRTPMLGNYSAKDTATVLTGNPNKDYLNYSLKIVTDGDISKIDITDFSDLFSSDVVVSDVRENGKNLSFNIPAQKPDGDYTVSGHGEYNAKNEVITITYSVMSPDGESMEYVGTWTKN